LVRGTADTVTRPSAAEARPRPEQPVLGERARGLARRAALPRSAPLGTGHRLLRELPRARPGLAGRAAARPGPRGSRSQHAGPDERALPALVRLGRRQRQPLGAEPAAAPRSA